ncbi:putative Gdt1 family protein [Helianthus annuus]|nr:putative Gdt1 family protein [Helianthus annuus]
MEDVEEKLESGQGKTAARRFFSRFCTPIFLEVHLIQWFSIFIVCILVIVLSIYIRCIDVNEAKIFKC